MENELRPEVPPIAAPTGDVAPRVGDPQEAVVDYRSLALWHRRMLWAWLLSCFTDVAYIATQVDDFERADASALVLFIGAILIALVALVLRCVTVYKVAQALRDFLPWLAAVLSIWGLFGFFIMLSFNKRACRKMRAAGIRVGFWGAKHQNIPTENN